MRRQRLVGSAEQRELRVDVLDDRLDHQIGGRELGGLGHSAEHLRRGRSPLRLELLEALLHPGEAALDGAGEGVVEQHLTAGSGDDLGDAGAHLAGADDEDALEAHRRTLSSGSRRLTVRIEYASTPPRMRTPISSLIALPFGSSTLGEHDAGVRDPAAGREPGAVGAIHQDPGGDVLGDHLAAVRGLDRNANATSPRSPFTSWSILKW